jgi:hypothetical protein
MQTHVNLEASFCGKEATADVASEKLLSSMRFEMTVQC